MMDQFSNFSKCAGMSQHSNRVYGKENMSTGSKVCPLRQFSTHQYNACSSFFYNFAQYNTHGLQLMEEEQENWR